MSSWQDKLSYFDDDLANKIRQWMDWDKCEQTRTEVEKLVAENAPASLRPIFMDRTSFGTAGLRAPMGAGFSCMNELVYIQAAQGLTKYCMTAQPNFKQAGVVVGFDGRIKSDKFARIMASVFLHAGIKVHFLDRFASTPLVSFAVTHCGAGAAAMVTASHNPKMDNGLKVYWSNGAQIVPPHDSNISASILENLSPWETSWDDSIVDTSPLCIRCMDEVWEAYKAASVKQRCFTKETNACLKTPVAFAAFHGVGYLFVPGLLEAFGFDPSFLVPVKEMMDPDGTFPCVKFPNPEEGPVVWEVALKAADKIPGCTLILACDPDADRFQLAEKYGQDWRIFTGNEIGTLMTWWLWENWKKKNPGVPPERICMINSTVSSKFMKTMADKEGFVYHETLTGFKWMGNKAIEQRAAGKYVLLAFEESIGYMCGEWLDKDGVLATAIFSELYAQILKNGKTFATQLDEIYQKYGYHLSYISYARSTDTAVTKKIFDRLRNWNGTPKSYPPALGKYNVQSVRDLTIGFDSSVPDGKPVLPVSSSSQMITFTMASGSRVTVRGSGTEPKIKYYVEVITKPGSDLGSAEEQLSELCAAALDDLIQPKVHNLELKED